MRKYLLLGCTGVGKSSFINSTFGRYIAETSEFEACTQLVQHYAYNTPLGDIHLIDTPGLAENLDDKVDRHYLSMVKQHVNLSSIYSILYVTPLNETRFRPNEKRTLSLITRELGVSTWHRAILVMTFSASIPTSRRDEASDRRRDDIESYLKQESRYQFRKFKSCWRVDNQCIGWSKNGKSVVSLLTA